MGNETDSKVASLTRKSHSRDEPNVGDAFVTFLADAR